MISGMVNSQNVDTNIRKKNKPIHLHPEKKTRTNMDKNENGEDSEVDNDVTVLYEFKNVKADTTSLKHLGNTGDTSTPKDSPFNANKNINNNTATEPIPPSINGPRYQPNSFSYSNTSTSPRKLPPLPPSALKKINSPSKLNRVCFSAKKQPIISSPRIYKKSPKKHTSPDSKNKRKFLNSKHNSPVVARYNHESDITTDTDETDKDWSYEYSKTDYQWGSQKKKNNKKQLGNKDMKDTFYNENSILKSLLTDPNVPYVLSHYLQLLFDVILCGIVIYLAYGFMTALHGDITKNIDKLKYENQKEIDGCSHEYMINQCKSRGDQGPMMKDYCQTLESCMNRDPLSFGRAKITVQTLAEVINSFMEPISFKSLTFIVLITVGSVFLVNYAFFNYRSSSKNIRKNLDSHNTNNTTNPLPPPTTPRRQANMNGTSFTPSSFANTPDMFMPIFTPQSYYASDQRMSSPSRGMIAY